MCRSPSTVRHYSSTYRHIRHDIAQSLCELWRLKYFVSLDLVFRYLLHPFYTRPHQSKPSGHATNWWFTDSEAFERNIYVSALQSNISKFAEAVVEWYLNNAVGLNKRHWAKWGTRVMILAQLMCSGTNWQEEKIPLSLYVSILKLSRIVICFNH